MKHSGFNQYLHQVPSMKPTVWAHHILQGPGAPHCSQSQAARTGCWSPQPKRKGQNRLWETLLCKSKHLCNVYMGHLFSSCCLPVCRLRAGRSQACTELPIPLGCSAHEMSIHISQSMRCKSTSSIHQQMGKCFGNTVVEPFSHWPSLLWVSV